MSQLINDMIYILKTFFIVNHKYVFKKTNTYKYPIFFTVLSPWNTDDTIQIECVKHECYLNKNNNIVISPKWNEKWTIQSLPKNCIMNCVPFDDKINGTVLIMDTCTENFPDVPCHADAYDSYDACDACSTCDICNIQSTYTRASYIDFIHLEYELFKNTGIDFKTFSIQQYNNDIDKMIQVTNEINMILKSFFVVNHKFVSLRVNNCTYPVFFTVLTPWGINDTIQIECVKHECYLDEDDCYLVIPKWNEKWMITTLPEDSICNCVPFDENRIYVHMKQKETDSDRIEEI